MWEYSGVFLEEFCCGVGSSAVPTCMWAGSPYKSLKCSCSEFGVGCEAGRAAGTCSRNGFFMAGIVYDFIFLYIYLITKESSFYLAIETSQTVI